MSIGDTLDRYRASLLLALALLLLGTAAAYGATQLQGAISRQMRADAASAICASFQNQEYDALAEMVDPAPITPVAAQTFNRKTLIAQLQSIDQHQGRVSACSWHLLQADDESATYVFSLSRPQTPVPIGMLVIFRHEPTGDWRISRRSPFTSAPV
ncbi:MAG TPA: hypothetical protein VF040_04375 [Ktedonobacterales bacterium]